MSQLIDQGESLRDLIARLIDNTKAYMKAEVDLVRTTVKVKLIEARFAAAFVVVALCLVNAATIVLVAALGMALARWLGPAGGLAVAAVLALVIAGVLVKLAVSQLTGKKA